MFFQSHMVTQGRRQLPALVLEVSLGFVGLMQTKWFNTQAQARLHTSIDRFPAKSRDSNPRVRLSVDTAHPRVVGHAVDREHVGGRSRIN